VDGDEDTTDEAKPTPRSRAKGGTSGGDKRSTTPDSDQPEGPFTL
jgi:hypothetical protein